jgi:hypothetical protein
LIKFKIKKLITNTMPYFKDNFQFTGYFSVLLLSEYMKKEITSKLGLRNISRDEWLRIRDGFLERNPQSGGPRDKLQKSALDILGERSDYRTAMNEIMTIGNQAYHYNFGLTLTDEDEYGVAVDTTLGAAFDELLQTRQIERGQLDNIPL